MSRKDLELEDWRRLLPAKKSLIFHNSRQNPTFSSKKLAARFEKNHKKVYQQNHNRPGSKEQKAFVF
jgi:hypothetical protein